MTLKLEKLSIKNPITLNTTRFEIFKGEKIALLGPSGSGKSTFLKMLAGFIPLHSGQISWKGKFIQSMKPAERPISFLFQTHNLFMHLSVRQNIALAICPNLRLSTQDWQQVDEICYDLELDAVQAKLPRQISGGQSARAALARIILQDKDIILFDEPFSTLGPTQIERIQHIIESKLVDRGRIVIFVSHQVDDALEWCDRILWLNDGAIDDPMITKSFIQNPPEGVKAYFGKKLTDN